MNEWYTIAKIACIKLVQAYRILYGNGWISAMAATRSLSEAQFRCSEHSCIATTVQSLWYFCSRSFLLTSLLTLDKVSK